MGRSLGAVQLDRVSPMAFATLAHVAGMGCNRSSGDAELGLLCDMKDTALAQVLALAPDHPAVQQS